MKVQYLFHNFYHSHTLQLATTISVVRNANRVFNTMHSETRSPQDVKVSFWLSFKIITSGLH